MPNTTPNWIYAIRRLPMPTPACHKEDGQGTGAANAAAQAQRVAAAVVAPLALALLLSDTCHVEKHALEGGKEPSE